jgi:hypothetical protein
MGASGHNAAHAALADAGDPAAGSRPALQRPGRRGVIHRVMETEAGRKAGYALARQRVFRPVARLAARRRQA